EAEADAIVNDGPLATVPESVSVPPLAVIVPVPLRFALTLPEPVSVAPLPTIRPAASSTPPTYPTLMPLAMLSATLIVRLPPLPISSVCLALLIVLALPSFPARRSSDLEAEADAIVNDGPLATVPDSVSVPALAVIVPVPLRFAVTLPEPVSVALLP